MHKIITPAVPEIAEYICDFTGKKLKNWPAATLIMDFGYGSEKDGASFQLDLSDEAAQEILDLIKSKLTKKSKKALLENNMYNDLLWD